MHIFIIVLELLFIMNICENNTKKVFVEFIVRFYY